MSKEYIEREAAIKHKRIMRGVGFSEQDEYLAPAVLVEDIKKIPAADVEEVVRCKNCSIGFEVETDHPLHPVRKYIYCPDRNEEVEPDGFCKWSKRRE